MFFSIFNAISKTSTREIISWIFPILATLCAGVWAVFRFVYDVAPQTQILICMNGECKNQQEKNTTAAISKSPLVVEPNPKPLVGFVRNGAISPSLPNQFHGGVQFDPLQLKCSLETKNSLEIEDILFESTFKSYSVPNMTPSQTKGLGIIDIPSIKLTVDSGVLRQAYWTEANTQSLICRGQSCIGANLLKGDELRKKIMLDCSKREVVPIVLISRWLGENTYGMRLQIKGKVADEKFVFFTDEIEIISEE